MTPKFGCKKNSYRKNDGNKISVEILTLYFVDPASRYNFCK